MSCNSAGYMGTQVARNGNTESRTFIFSCWDADSAHKVIEMYEKLETQIYSL